MPDRVPSYFCTTGARTYDVRGAHECDPTGMLDTHGFTGAAGNYDTPMLPDAHDRAAGDASAGYGPGMVLMPFFLDWGDRVVKPRRVHFLTTILKQWPRREDRRLALTTVDYWVPESDACNPPMTAYLLRAEPFAGYGWDAHALEKWLGLIQVDPCGAPPRLALPEPEAIPLAVAWLDHAATEWRRYSNEPFPYGLLDLLEYWTLELPDATLSDASATPTSL